MEAESTEFMSKLLRNAKGFKEVFDGIFEKYGREFVQEEFLGQELLLGELGGESVVDESESDSDWESQVLDDSSILRLPYCDDDGRSESRFLDSCQETKENPELVLLCERFVKVKKELRWDDEELAYQKRKLECRKIDCSAGEDSTDSELACSNSLRSRLRPRRKRQKLTETDKPAVANTLPCLDTVGSSLPSHGGRCGYMGLPQCLLVSDYYMCSGYDSS